MWLAILCGLILGAVTHSIWGVIVGGIIGGLIYDDFKAKEAQVSSQPVLRQERQDHI